LNYLLFNNFLNFTIILAILLSICMRFIIFIS